MADASDPKKPIVKPVEQGLPTEPPEPKKPVGPTNRFVKGTRVDQGKIRSEDKGES